MNVFVLIGRLTRDPEVSYSAKAQMPVAKFTLAIDAERLSRDGTRHANYPKLTAFGRNAEICEKYLRKGRLIAVQGYVKTNTYKKDGKTAYGVNLIAEKIQFMTSRSEEEAAAATEAELPQGDDFTGFGEMPF